ncbi:MAG: class I SAM-dependent methyltransferase [Magnetococcales bacterium]|nr:class I SAM-dependent methyltransferase [Magnetococcales bacterium]
MKAYSRNSPSPLYVELLENYCIMHNEGQPKQNVPADKTFEGRSLPLQAESIFHTITEKSANTILDYGSGKGLQYGPLKVTTSDGKSSFPDIKSYWGVQSITCYDPGYEPFSTLPEGRFDGVICTDVMEHLPLEDVPWVINEIFSFARKFVFLSISCFPSKKFLPNDENAHCTVKPIEWWLELLNCELKKWPTLSYTVVFISLEIDPDTKEKKYKLSKYMS